MKHECQNITLQLSLPWVFGFPFWNGFAALILIWFQRVLSILQLTKIKIHASENSSLVRPTISNISLFPLQGVSQLHF